MATLQIARYQVRPEACTEAEKAMHELASYVHNQLPGVAWTTYRDAEAPGSYISLSRADDAVAKAKQRSAAGTQTFAAALAPLLVGTVDVTELELVTSSDLGRRPKAGKKTRRAGAATKKRTSARRR